MIQAEASTLATMPSRHGVLPIPGRRRGTHSRFWRIRQAPSRGRKPKGKGGKDRVVPFPPTFRETLALHIADRRKTGGSYLFESSWKKPYSTRGVRALLSRYATIAGLSRNMPPHRLRHFLFNWLKTQTSTTPSSSPPYSGHASRQSLEIYSRLALSDAQASYDEAIGRFPV